MSDMEDATVEPVTAVDLDRMDAEHACIATWKDVRRLASALRAAWKERDERWMCEDCGASFPPLLGDEGVTVCSRCVEVAGLNHALATAQAERDHAIALMDTARSQTCASHDLAKIPYAEAQCLVCQRDAALAERDKARNAGVGYSQQTVDALTKERDGLQAQIDTFKQLVNKTREKLAANAVVWQAQQDELTAQLTEARLAQGVLPMSEAAL